MQKKICYEWRNFILCTFQKKSYKKASTMVKSANSIAGQSRSKKNVEMWKNANVVSCMGSIKSFD